MVGLGLFVAACGGAVAIRAPERPPSPEQIKELWIDPGDEPRDLFWGIGGKKYAPAPDAVYKFKDADDIGFSSSYGVKDKDDVEWSAKIGPGGAERGRRVAHPVGTRLPPAADLLPAVVEART